MSQVRCIAGRLLLWCVLSLPGAVPADEIELPVQSLVRTLLEEQAHPLVEWHGMQQHLEPVRRFYAARGWDPAWSRHGQPTLQARELLLELRSVTNKGLEAADYSGLRLTYLLIDLMTTPGAGPGDWALWDIAMSAAVSRYVADLHFGRIDPATLGLGISVDRSRLDVATLLGAIAGSGDPRSVVADVEPDFRTYETLKRELARYRELAQEPALTLLPTFPARSLKPGDPYEGAAALRRLLVTLHDLPDSAAAPAGLYDEALAEGVKAFQYRHGLEPDGNIGKDTYRALTTPLATRARQIELSLERWRWLPQKLDSPPIVVNIPQYKLFAFQDTTDDLERMLVMDVVVGNAYRQQLTPVFTADMTYLVFRPYWDVPYSIAMKELLPDARRRRGYLTRNHFEIVRGYGERAPRLAENSSSLAAVAAGTARIRERPGPKNSLGAVKFMLPNRYNVYLHDTPAGHLFSRARRDFSHGCVRVSDPKGLAEHVLRDDPAWTRASIEAAMTSGPPSQVVKLQRPIRVYFVYATAMASPERVFFFDDIYGHDATLDAALRSRARQ